jgi:hypothetical protein
MLLELWLIEVAVLRRAAATPRMACFRIFVRVSLLNA